MVLARKSCRTQYRKNSGMFRGSSSEGHHVCSGLGQHDVPLLLLIAPYRYQVSDPVELRTPQDRLVAYAQANRLPYLDVLREWEALPDGAAYRGFHDESHLSRLGHDLVADLLIEPVESLADLPAVGSPEDSPERLERKAAAYALAARATAAAERGEYRYALELLDEAQRIAPDVGLFYQYRSNVAYLMDDPGAALRALARGLRLEPHNPLFQRNATALIDPGARQR